MKCFEFKFTGTAKSLMSTLCRVEEFDFRDGRVTDGGEHQLPNALANMKTCFFVVCVGYDCF